MKKIYFLFIGGLLTAGSLIAQEKTKQFTHGDTLRGTLNPERTWWDVQHYDIQVTPDYAAKAISGTNIITYKVTTDSYPAFMQIDLQEPMQIDSVLFGNSGRKMQFTREGNAWHVQAPKQVKGSTGKVTVFFHGTPRAAVRPPWDGGWIWTKDEQGRPWMSVACQGLGASVWYPCKDHQSDEPDNGAALNITVADSLVAVGNGRLINKISANGLTTYSWKVVNPINNYNIIPYIGKYVNFTDTVHGEKGTLDMSYWVLDYNLPKAKEQFLQAKQMIHAFEYWFGPYPFYEDSYKLVDAPHLGMEHQSAVAYGNQYKNGYRGRDLSASGWGLKWDFIIIHESGHEWFANSITTKDIADMWVHEGFTNYSETLFTEYYYGKEAGNDYCYGSRRNIRNDKPIIAPYGVNEEGSGDMYPKASNMLHAIRHAIDNDEKFRQILRGLSKTFYHETVTTQQIENYISKQSGINFSKVFDQYLRTTQVPKLEYYFSKDKSKVFYRWANCVEGFNLPIVLRKDNKSLSIKPTTSWQDTNITSAQYDLVTKELIERLYYVVADKSKN